MNKYDKYTPLLGRVSTQLKAAYEKITGVSLEVENERYIMSRKSAGLMTKLMIALCYALIFSPIPLAVILHKSGLVTDGVYALITAIFITGIVVGALFFYSLYKLSLATDVRNRSDAALKKFEIVIQSFEPRGFRSADRPPIIDQEVVHKSLIAMAKDVMDAESLETYAQDILKLDSVPDICGIFDNGKRVKQKLLEGLNYQEMLGLAYRRPDLFRDAEALAQQK